MQCGGGGGSQVSWDTYSSIPDTGSVGRGDVWGGSQVSQDMRFPGIRGIGVYSVWGRESQISWDTYSIPDTGGVVGMCAEDPKYSGILDTGI